MYKVYIKKIVSWWESFKFALQIEGCLTQEH